MEAVIKEAKRLHRKDRAFQQRFGSRPAIVTYSSGWFLAIAHLRMVNLPREFGHICRLPPAETVRAEFGCVRQGGKGTLYLSAEHLCFEADAANAEAQMLRTAAVKPAEAGLSRGPCCRSHRHFLAPHRICA